MVTGSRVIATSTVIVLATAFMVWLVAETVFRRTSFEVQLLIPNGFRGVVTIIEDRTGTTPVYAGLQNGVYIYQYMVPQDGILRTRDIRPMTRYHTERAAFQNGTPLPVAKFIEDQPGKVMLRTLTGFGSGAVPGERAAYSLVGTGSEAHQFMNTMQVWNHIKQESGGREKGTF